MLPDINTVEPVYYGHLGNDQTFPDYQGVMIFQIILYDKVLFGTSTKCVDYACWLPKSVSMNVQEVIRLMCY